MVAREKRYFRKLTCLPQVTKKELAAFSSKEANFSEHKSAEFQGLVFEILAENLEGGEKIKIHGSGNFAVREKRKRPQDRRRDSD